VLAQIALCASLGSIAGWGSIDRGSIRGLISDPSGASIPRVAVTITNVNTGVKQTTQTDNAGFYLVNQLVPGTYVIHVAHPGFEPIDVANVGVNANEQATEDIQLKIGTTSQLVEVTSSNPLVQTDASNFTAYVAPQLVQDLPLVGRDVQGLFAVLPGVTQAAGPPGSMVGFNSSYSGFPDPTHIIGSGTSLNGSQPGGNVWYLDGNLNTAQGLDNAVVNPAPDAVAEYQAVTNNFAAEYGRTAGGVFSLVLKSGTNQFHGSLYEYNRNSYFSAWNPFTPRTQSTGAPTPQTYINSNQFGGTIGGPVLIPKVYDGKNRTFFFASWDVSLLHARKVATYTVPTMLERAGNFSEFPNIRQYGLFDPLTTKYNAANGTFVRQPFLNPDGTLSTSIPASRMDPTALWYLSQFPQPNFLDPTQQNAAAGGCLNTCNNYLTGYGSAQTGHNVTVKVDHSIGGKNKLFVEWLYDPVSYGPTFLPWQGPTAPLTGFNGAFPWRVTNIVSTLGLTTSVSPTLINEFRFSYSRQGDVPQPLPDSLVGTQDVLKQIQGLNLPVFPPLQPTPIMGIGGLSSFGGPSNNLIQVTQAFTLMDNVTKVMARHAIKAGFIYRLDQTGTEIPPNDRLSYGGTLVANATTGQGGNGVAQFMLGAVDSAGNQSSSRWFFPTYSSTHEWGVYVQDDFRVTSKLSANVGVRWDYYGWFSDRFGNASYFNFDQPNTVIPGLRGQIMYVGRNVPMFPAHHNDFAPRVNLAYAPTQKTVLRAGVDMVYTDSLTQVFGQGEGPSESPGYNVYSAWVGDATGQGLVNTGVVPAFILSQGAPSLPPFVDPKPLNSQVNIGSPGAGFLTQVPISHDPYVFIWNFTIQRQLPGDMALTVAYVGNSGHFLVGKNNRSYDYVPVSTILEQRSALNDRVPTPAQYVMEWGPTYFASQFLKPYPQYSNVSNFLANDNTSVYDGLQVNLTKRFSHGLNFQASYAWQKTIAAPGLAAYLSNTWTGGPSFGSGRGEAGKLPGLLGVGNGGPQNPDNRDADRSVASFDVPHTFNFSWTYELPIAKYASGRATRAIIGGWKLAGSFTATAGVPTQITGPSNVLTSRVDLIGDPNAGRSSKSRYQVEQQWYNPNAFEAVFGSDPSIIQIATNGTPQQKDQHDEFYRFGTAGYLLPNARVPGYWGSDMSLYKEFHISESKFFQVRVDAFNVFNHQNLGLPNATWCLGPNPDGSTDAVHKFGCQFGRITNVATDPRAFQFGLKLAF
jgi:hypothetical protein